MDMIFGRLIRQLNPESGPERVRVGRDMLDAFMRGVENYQPILGELPLKEEGGVSEVSYKNLCLLIDKFGPPSRVERHENVFEKLAAALLFQEWLREHCGNSAYGYPQFQGMTAEKEQWCVEYTDCANSPVVKHIATGIAFASR